MSLLKNLNDELKAAMKAKDTIKLEALRAIKSAVLLAQTSSGAGDALTDKAMSDDATRTVDEIHAYIYELTI